MLSDYQGRDGDLKSKDANLPSASWLYPAELRAQDEQKHIPRLATKAIEPKASCWRSLSSLLLVHHRWRLQAWQTLRTVS